MSFKLTLRVCLAEGVDGEGDGAMCPAAGELVSRQGMGGGYILIAVVTCR